MYQLRRILESISDSFYALDREWCFTYINKQAAAQLNRTPGDLIGKNIWREFPQRVGTEIERKYWQVMEEGKPQEFEWFSDIAALWYSIRVYPCAEGISVFGQNITERKQAEMALKENESNLKLLWNTMGHGVVYQDSQGKIVRMNPAAESILGKTPEQFMGKTSEDVEYDCIRPDGSLFPGIEHPSMISLRTGQEIHGVVMGVYNPKEKAYRWINISAIPLFHSKENKPYQVYTIFDDITELKKVEDALARSRNELAQANERLKQYSQRITQVQEDERKRIAYELHDDTAQYLGILKMQIGAVANSEEIQSLKIKEKLQYLERDANRAFDEVRRYSHELRPVVLEHQGLAAALEQIADDYNKLGQLTIGVNVAGMEPKLSEGVKLGFFRIAQEALNNTRKHANANQATINLKFNKKQVWMRVSDDGVGFDTDKALKKKRGKGKGKGSLSLMSMRERADMIQGDLQIESEPGKGTKVTLKARVKP